MQVMIFLHFLKGKGRWSAFYADNLATGYVMNYNANKILKDIFSLNTRYKTDKWVLVLNSCSRIKNGSKPNNINGYILLFGDIK